MLGLFSSAVPFLCGVRYSGLTTSICPRKPMRYMAFRNKNANYRNRKCDKCFLPWNACEKYGSCLRDKKRKERRSLHFGWACVLKTLFLLCMVTRCKAQGKVCTPRNPSETNGSRQLSLTASRLSLVTIYFRKHNDMTAALFLRFPTPFQVPAFRVSVWSSLRLRAHLQPGHSPLFRKWGKMCSFLTALSGSPR